MKQVYGNIALQNGALETGIVKVQIVPREWLAGNPVVDFNSGRVPVAVNLVTGRDWLTLEFAPLSYDYEEKPKSSKAGDFCEITVSGKLNNYGPDEQQIIESIRHSECVAVVMDRYKRNKIVGTMEAGLKLTPSNKIINTGGGNQDTTVQLIMESEDPAPFYLT